MRKAFGTYSGGKFAAAGAGAGSDIAEDEDLSNKSEGTCVDGHAKVDQTLTWPWKTF